MAWWDDYYVGSSDYPSSPIASDDPSEYLDPWDAAEAATRAGVREVDGELCYSAAWLDELVLA